MKVFVYRNLHANKWSIKALEGEHKGLVIGHAEDILLSNATPKVSKAGRERVLRTRKKYVHAGLVGTLAACEGVTWRKELSGDTSCNLNAHGGDTGTLISYNPYRCGAFFSADHGHEFLRAKHVLFDDNLVYAIDAELRPNGIADIYHI